MSYALCYVAVDPFVELLNPLAVDRILLHSIDEPQSATIAVSRALLDDSIFLDVAALPASDGVAVLV